MNGRIVCVSKFGNFSVYRREDPLDPGTKRYAIYREPDGYWMKDCRSITEAERFARWKKFESEAA